MIRHIFQEDGILGFYKGVMLLCLRQSINQSSNFAMYHYLTKEHGCPSFIAGCISGSVGPMLNNPIDIIKT